MKSKSFVIRLQFCAVVKVVGECDPKQETSKSMAEMMIGGDLKQIEKEVKTEFGAPRFVVDNLSQDGEGDFGVALSGISFTVRAGENFWHSRCCG